MDSIQSSIPYQWNCSNVWMYPGVRNVSGIIKLLNDCDYIYSKRSRDINFDRTVTFIWIQYLHLNVSFKIESGNWVKHHLLLPVRCDEDTPYTIKGPLYIQYAPENIIYPSRNKAVCHLSIAQRLAGLWDFISPLRPLPFPSRSDKIKASDESRGRLKGYELDDGESLRWRSVRERACRPTKFPRFSLNTLFFLPATFIPLPEPTYRRPGRQSIIRRRSSRDSTAGRKLSRSLICPAPVGPLCCCRSKDRNCLRFSSWNTLAQVFRLSQKSHTFATVINPTWSRRSFIHEPN